MVINLEIRENLIEDNGLNHLHSVCGIFVSRVAEFNISDNKIMNNGPYSSELVSGNLEPGIRGGIVLFSIGLWRERSRALSAGDRIQANVVTQPAGHALDIRTHGPVLVSNNIFKVLRSGCEGIGRVAGQHNEFIGALKIENTHLSATTQICENQIEVRVVENCWYAQYVYCAGDLLYSNNKAAVLSEPEVSLQCNIHLVASSLRVTGNRVAEPPSEGGLPDSIWAKANYLNTVTGNHVDHCIKASVQYTEKLYTGGNWSWWLDDAVCTSYQPGSYYGYGRPGYNFRFSTFYVPPDW